MTAVRWGVIPLELATTAVRRGVIPLEPAMTAVKRGVLPLKPATIAVRRAVPALPPWMPGGLMGEGGGEVWTVVGRRGGFAGSCRAMLADRAVDCRQLTE
jgi:hypothetical protein